MSYICTEFEDPVCALPEIPEEPEEWDEDLAYDEWRERKWEE